MQHYIFPAIFVGIFAYISTAHAVTKCVPLQRDGMTLVSFDAQQMTADWHAVLGNPTLGQTVNVSGVATCADVNQSDDNQTGPVAVEPENIHRTNVNAQNSRCYCRIIRPVVSTFWMRLGPGWTDGTACPGNCAIYCGRFAADIATYILGSTNIVD